MEGKERERRWSRKEWWKMIRQELRKREWNEVETRSREFGDQRAGRKDEVEGGEWKKNIRWKLETGRWNEVETR